MKPSPMQNFSEAECERCAGKWLIETNVEPDLLEGVCQDRQNESDTEKPLTFRTPTKIEIQTMASPLLPDFVDSVPTPPSSSTASGEGGKIIASKRRLSSVTLKRSRAARLPPDPMPAALATCSSCRFCRTASGSPELPPPNPVSKAAPGSRSKGQHCAGATPVSANPVPPSTGDVIGRARRPDQEIQDTGVGPMTPDQFDWAAHTEAVVADIFGEPNEKMSRPPDDVRFGNHGSVSINYTTGQWYDFENKRGGGIKELIRVYKEIDDRDAAIAYAEECQQNFENGEKPRPNGNAKAGQHHQREVEATYSILRRLRPGSLRGRALRLEAGRRITSPTRKASASRPSASAGPRGNPTGVGCGDSTPANSCAAAPGKNWVSFNAAKFEQYPATRQRKVFNTAAPVVPLSAPRSAESGRRRPDDLHRRRREESRPHSQLWFSRRPAAPGARRSGDPEHQRIPAGRRRCAVAG